jgi:hypothetical protein
MVQIGLLNYVEETHVSLYTRALFPWTNWFSFWKSTSCMLGVSRGKKALFAPTRTIQQSWRDTCVSPEEILYVRSLSIEHVVSLWELIRFWKEYFMQLKCFKEEICWVFFMTVFSDKLKNNRNLSKENCLFLKHDHAAHYFSVRIELLLKRNTSCKS